MPNEVDRRSSKGQLTVQAVGTAVAGGAGWATDVLLLWLLASVLGLPVAVSAALAFAASGGLNFLLNRLVYRGTSGQNKRQILRYVSLFAANLLLTSVLVPGLLQIDWFLPNHEDVRLVTAKVVVSALLLVGNTFAYRHWVFVPRAVSEATSRVPKDGGQGNHE